MNISNTYILRAAAALMLCVFAASCSQSDLGIAQGEELPEGQYPLKFTASVEGMATRAAGKDAWDKDDAIGVKIYRADALDYPVTGKYFLNTDGSVKRSENPLAWPITDGTVKAWFPYVGEGQTKTVSIAGQSEGFEEFDFLTAIAEKQHYTNTVDLNFKHQMAKVSCKLVKGTEGVTDEDMKTATVTFGGFTQASFKEGNLTGSFLEDNEENCWITPLTISNDTPESEFEALVVPQDMKGKPFIKVELSVKVNGFEKPKVLIYTPKDGEVNLVGGRHYHYEIAVQKDRLVVTSFSAEWIDDGEPKDADENILYKVKMPDNISDVFKAAFVFSSEITNGDAYKNGDSNVLRVKGNQFTISYTLRAGEKEILFSIKKPGKLDVQKNTISGSKYTFDFTLRSPMIELTWVEPPHVGDFYYSDGTWSTERDDKKTCIGIVFKSGAGGSDNPGAYGWTDRAIQGYAMALTNVKEMDSTTDPPSEKSTFAWGPAGTSSNGSDIGCSISNNVSNYNGYDNTKKILDIVTKEKPFPAFTAAKSYNTTCPAPAESSGWYLPSYAQLKDLLNQSSTMNVKIGKAKGDLIITNDNYWSSTFYQTNARGCYTKNNTSSSGATAKNSARTTEFHVRPILTF